MLRGNPPERGIVALGDKGNAWEENWHLSEVCDNGPLCRRGGIATPSHSTLPYPG